MLYNEEMIFIDLLQYSRGGVNATYHVSLEVYKAFQMCSKDINPLHTDEEFAKRKGFPGCVMYGNILNAFISHFVGVALPCDDVMIQTQDIQYRKPVYMGDTIILRATPEDVSEAVQIINYKLKFYRQIDEKEELVATGHVQIGMLNDKF